MKHAYFQPLAPVQVSYQIKKSEFITRIACIESKQQMKNFVQQARDDYPDARHHCWAYILGDPTQASSMASSDDGEPSGTAGKPMLNVLSHKNVGNIGVVIIRYFGGIKLGAGGLVRAYSSATQKAMDALALDLKEPLTSLTVQAKFSAESQLRHYIEKLAGQIVSVTYSEQLTVAIVLPTKSVDEFKVAFQADDSVIISVD